MILFDNCICLLTLLKLGIKPVKNTYTVVCDFPQGFGPKAIALKGFQLLLWAGLKGSPDC